MADYQMSCDPITGIVTVRLHGFMSDAEAEVFAGALKEACGDARRRHGRLRMMFDNRQCAVFSTRTLQVFSDKLKADKRATDRIAILVENALSKMQIKRSLDEGKRTFASEHDARAWLTEASSAAA